MAIHKWRAEFHGEEWGADGDTVWPSALAAHVLEREGMPQVTYYGKPYLLTARDAGSVFDAFTSEFDPRGERDMIFMDMDPVVPDGRVY
jgi:hypothetical protein